MLPQRILSFCFDEGICHGFLLVLLRGCITEDDFSCLRSPGRLPAAAAMLNASHIGELPKMTGYGPKAIGFPTQGLQKKTSRFCKFQHSGPRSRRRHEGNLPGGTGSGGDLNTKNRGLRRTKYPAKEDVAAVDAGRGAGAYHRCATAQFWITASYNAKAWLRPPHPPVVTASPGGRYIPALSSSE